MNRRKIVGKEFRGGGAAFNVLIHLVTPVIHVYDSLFQELGS
jgi:hypothetical protein